MRKFLTMLAICLMSFIGAYAQNTTTQVNETKEVYCMIVGTSNLIGTKVTITIDYGQRTSFWAGVDKMKVVGEDGKTLKFNSMIDASNYLSSMGWTLVNAYPAHSKQGSCYHFVFKKIVGVNDNVEFTTKGNTPKERKEKHTNDDMYQ